MTREALRREQEALEREGAPYAVATVVWRRAPTSAHVGARALVLPDGRLLGWVGGACSEPAVIREGVRAIREARPRVLCLGPKTEFGPPDEARAIVEGACLGEGALEIFIEPRLVEPRLLVVGETPVARALVDLAERIGLAAERCTPAALCAGHVGGVGAQTFAVVASFGSGDEDALAQLLRGAAPYVALVASRRRAEAVRAVLRRRGVEEADLARLRAPAGLDLGPIRHEEIAVAVLAEIAALRAQQAQASLELEETSDARGDEVVDPVCGMTLLRGSARERLQHGGALVYFCSEHCRAHYAEQLEREHAGRET